MALNREFRDIVNIGPHCHERFIDSTNTPEIKALDIELAGCSNLSGTYQVARVTPPNHTIFYTLSGEGCVSTPQDKLALPKHSLVLLPADQSFEVRITAEHWDIIWLNLTNSPRWQHLRTPSAQLKSNVDLASVHHAMELLYLESDGHRREGVIPIIQHHLRSVVSQEANVQQARIDVLFSEVEKQLQFDWTVDIMAKRAHYSAPHLHRLCLEKYGRSPIQQVIHLRMIRAKNLLENTQWPVAHIAHYVGYTSVFTFSKRFKKSVGVSPTDYRLSTINSNDKQNTKVG